MTIVFPSNTKEIIDKIRGVIGRDISIFYTTSGEPCVECAVDTVTGKSMNPFCPVCSGIGYIRQTNSITVSAHVLWHSVDSSYNLPVGRIRTGDCKVTVSYDPEVLTIIEDADYFLVDDRKLYMVEYDLRGVQPINRIAVSLKQDPRDGRKNG